MDPEELWRSKLAGNYVIVGGQLGRINHYGVCMLDLSLAAVLMALCFFGSNVAEAIESSAQYSNQVTYNLGGTNQAEYSCSSEFCAYYFGFSYANLEHGFWVSGQSLSAATGKIGTFQELDALVVLGGTSFNFFGLKFLETSLGAGLFQADIENESGKEETKSGVAARGEFGFTTYNLPFVAKGGVAVQGLFPSNKVVISDVGSNPMIFGSIGFAWGGS